MKRTYWLYPLLFALWIGVSLLCALHINKKGISENGPTFFADSSYNFEYKRGFPTPWYSRYYTIPANKLDIYSGSDGQVATPPDDYLIYTDISKPVLVGQILLATIPSLSLLILVRVTPYIPKSERRKNS